MDSKTIILCLNHKLLEKYVHTLTRGFLGLSHTFSKRSNYSKHALPWDVEIWPWLTIHLYSLNLLVIAHDL